MNGSVILQNFFPKLDLSDLPCVTIPISQLALPSDSTTVSHTNATLPPTALLSPLLVFKSKNETYEIIDGCKRFAASKKTGNSNCLCRILPETTTDVQKKILRIACNADRENTLSEQYHIINWTTSHLTADERQILLNNLGWDTKRIRALKDLLQCDTLTIDTVCTQKIHAENALEFSRLPESDRKAFLDFFCDLRLSQQYEREFMEWLPEIAYIKNQTIADILLSPILQEFKNSTALNAPQKIQKIREYLFSCKFPRYAETLDAWKKCAHKTFPNPAKIALTPNPFFEKDKLELRISVATAKEAQDTFENLAAIPVDIWTQLICPYK